MDIRKPYKLDTQFQKFQKVDLSLGTMKFEGIKYPSSFATAEPATTNNASSSTAAKSGTTRCASHHSTAAEVVSAEPQKEYTIDDILDSVEMGDTSILKELNIPFTEFSDGSGYQKISFKFNGVRYTVNIIPNTSEDSDKIDDDGANEADATDDSKGGEKTIESLKAQREECVNKLNDVEQQISSLKAPTLPNPNDYTLQDGSLDNNQAYQEAMNNYNYELAVYDQKIQELNRIAIETSSQLQLLDAEIAELELKQRTDKLQEDIDALKDSPNANQDLINALEKQLEFVKTTGANTSGEKTLLLNQQAEVRLALFNLVVPTPPSTTDFMRSDGTVDEEAYREALDKYELDSYSYNQDKQGLEEKLSIINNALRNLSLEEVKSADIDKLEKNIDVAKNIQQQLDNISDKNGNRVFVARLKNMLAALANNFDKQTAIMEQLSALQEEIINAELPIPPKASDFMKMVYSYTIGEKKYTIKELRQVGDETYIALLTNGSAMLCKPAFDENGNITDLTIIQGNSETKVGILAESVVDEKAYTNAMWQYERQMSEYDKKMNDFNKQSEKFSNSLSNLEQQLDWLNFASSTTVLENKISDCRINGDYREAHILEKKLNELRKEFANIQAQKRNLLNKEKNLQNRLNSLVAPKPPKTNDYMNYDGTVNERAYKNAYERFEKQSSQFDRITARINESLEIVQGMLNVLNERAAELQAEIEELVQ